MNVYSPVFTALHVMQTRYCDENSVRLSVTVTVTVTKVFILRFLLKDRKCITESFTYIQRSPG